MPVTSAHSPVPLIRLGCSLLIMTLSVAPVWAQRGDKRGERQPETWKKFDLPVSPPLSPAEALKSFKIAPGFKLELFAAEPRLWIRWRWPGTAMAGPIDDRDAGRPAGLTPDLP